MSEIVRSRRVTREKYLSDAELERFMSVVRSRRHVNQPRDHALFVLLANTGIRPFEARALSIGDVNARGRPPRIHLNRVKKRHAAAPIRVLPLHPAVAKVLARYVDTMDGVKSELLFPFTPRQSARLFHYYAAKAGLPAHYRIYCLRHTAGIRLWRHTRDVRMVQAIMGHVHLNATTRYEHVDRERMLAAHEAMGVLE